MNTAIAYTIFLIILLSWACDAVADDSIWLARSCTGDAGWKAHETGECAAILHIYKKRAESAGITTVEMAKRYSAAIKRHKNRPNRWVLFLNGSEQPHFWPLVAKWKYCVMNWLQTKFTVSLFMQDKLSDPLPKAWHYGSKDDPQPPNTKLIKTPFRNRFYRRIWE